MKMNHKVCGVLVTAAVFFGGGALADEGRAITAENWTLAVGFAPDLDTVGCTPGKALGSDDVGTAKACLADGVAELMTRYKMNIWTSPYKAIRPSDGYVLATSVNAGKASVVDTGKSYRKNGLVGYEGGGLPFVQPESGKEIGYNIQFAYRGDDRVHEYGIYWIRPGRGVWQTQVRRDETIFRATGRTDVGPKTIKGLVHKGVERAVYSRALEPYDVDSLANLHFWYDQPIDHFGWVYVPFMRNDLRMTSGIPGAIWESTDFMWEDLEGVSGHTEWMDWKVIGKRTILAPMHAGIVAGRRGLADVIDLDRVPRWNPRMYWEPRPVYVVEITEKMDDYHSHPYGRSVLYVDAETFFVPIKETYDRKGDLFRVIIHAYNEAPNPGETPPIPALGLAVDVQRNRATAVLTHDFKVNVNLPESRFTETRLRNEGN